MDELAKLDKRYVRKFCEQQNLPVIGSLRQLLANIASANIADEIVYGFVEDTLEQIEIERSLQERQELAEREAREIRRLELQIELQRLQSNANNIPHSPRSEVTDLKNVVKMYQYLAPYETGGDIGMFLTNFERLAEQLEVPIEQRSLQLMKLLPTHITAVIARLSPSDASCYSKVKETLLTRFKLSPEAFRLRFRQAHRKHGQSYSEFGYYIESNLHEWISGNDIRDSFDKLKELVALEQFYKTIPDSLRHWLLDRNPGSLAEACTLADVYESRRSQNTDRHLDFNKSNVKQVKAFGKENKIVNLSQEHNSSSQVNESKDSSIKSAGVSKQASKDFNRRQELVCYNCGKKGHYARTCDKPKALTLCACESRFKPAISKLLEPYVMSVLVNGIKVSSLRDTGASHDVVSQNLVSEEDYLGEEICLRQALDADPCFLPLARVDLRGTFGQLQTVAAVAKDPPVPYIISNLTASQCKAIDSAVFPALAVTRQMTRKLQRDLALQLAQEEDMGSKENCIVPLSKEVHPSSSEVSDQESPDNVLKQSETAQNIDLPDVSDKVAVTNVFDTLVLPALNESLADKLKVSREEFLQLQQEDATLKPLFQKIGVQSSTGREKFQVVDGLLVRFWQDKNGFSGDQLVLPERLRLPVVELAHSSVFGGHLGIKKSRTRVLSEYYFPGVFGLVKQFIKTCPICQKVGHHKDIARAPMCKVPLISEPFRRLSIDIVGPLPMSKDGYTHILTTQCMATRFPDAVPLKQIKSEDVVDALMQIFSRYGFAQELQSDLGTVFTSQLMKVFTQRTGIKQVFSSPYHPQTNPVERMHGILKKILRSLLFEHGEDWVHWLPMALFAIRQMPNASLGFSPSELVYGRALKGPLNLLRDRWSPNSGDKETVVEYVLKILERIHKSTEVAKQCQLFAQNASKIIYDRKSKRVEYKEGDLVLLLVPCRPNKLAVKWTGPMRVLKRIRENNYVVETIDQRKKQKIVHVNLLKPFYERVCCINVVSKPEDNMTETLDDSLTCPLSSDGAGETHEFTNWLQSMLARLDLDRDQLCQLRILIAKYPTVFSVSLGRTTAIEHDIEVTNTVPIYQPPYRLNPRVRELVGKEIDLMLRHDLIRPSTSEYSSPMILVEAEGKSPRACVDYRKLNSITRQSKYPIPNIEERIEQVANARFITTLDLRRGYWQVPLTERASYLAAFSCHLGTFQPTVLSFGLSGGPMTFQRLMDMILKGCESFANAFQDDIAVFSNDWNSHTKHLELVLDRLSNANLVVKREKSQFAQKKVLYLGHLIGQGELSPSTLKTLAVTKMQRPQTKKEIKSFVGICSYYKRYIPKFSDVAAPLTDALRKNAPSKVLWTELMEKAFIHLKACISSSPVLKAPDFNQEFILQTDASLKAVSAVLSQKDNLGEEHPVLFISKKLHPREAHWSTIERECYALVWAIQKLRPYLQYTHFIVQTDHSPLQFLANMSNKNARLLRWSLMLQQNQFSIQHRAGRFNGNADCLSRLPQI